MTAATCAAGTSRASGSAEEGSAPTREASRARPSAAPCSNARCLVARACRLKRLCTSSYSLGRRLGRMLEMKSTWSAALTSLVAMTCRAKG